MDKRELFEKASPARALTVMAVPTVISQLVVLLYNLAELQNECSRRFKKTPDETLSIVQELYEKKLVTYPRTDARVLSTAVAKEIAGNLKGLTGYEPLSKEAQEVLEKGAYKGIEKSRYTDDKKITDHYAIIPTGHILTLIDVNFRARTTRTSITHGPKIVFFTHAHDALGR